MRNVHFNKKIHTRSDCSDESNIKKTPPLSHIAPSPESCSHVSKKKNYIYLKFILLSFWRSYMDVRIPSSSLSGTTSGQRLERISDMYHKGMRGVTAKYANARLRPYEKSVSERRNNLNAGHTIDIIWYEHPCIDASPRLMVKLIYESIFGKCYRAIALRCQ